MNSEEGEEKKFSPKFNKKKKNSKSYATKHFKRDVPELLRGMEFSMDRNGPDL